MYDRSARYYDAIYSFKDYAAEAEMLRALIEARRPGARRLLDVACGTGEHLKHLQAWYDVEGVDASGPMLAVAREKLPGVPLEQADMLGFDLGRTFDAVVCMFGATGHLPDEAALGTAVARIARHLEPGGVAILEPWLTPEKYTAGRVSGLMVDQPELKVARMSVGRVEDGRAVMDLHHLVATPSGVEHFVERLDMTLFPHEAYARALDAAGLRVEFDPQGPMDRGLFIGVSPAERG
jgi:SAM-dependent methyltransferase